MVKADVVMGRVCCGEGVLLGVEWQGGGGDDAECRMCGHCSW